MNGIDPCDSDCVFCFLYRDMPIDYPKLGPLDNKPSATASLQEHRPNPNKEMAKQFRSDRRSLLEKFTGNLFVHVDDSNMESILYRYKPIFLDFVSQAMEEQRRL